MTNNPDSIRLDTLIDLYESNSSEFEEYLFFAARNNKNDLRKAYREALDKHKEINE